MPTRLADDLFSVATKDAAEAQALSDRLRDAHSYVEVVPGIKSVVVQFDPTIHDATVVRSDIEAVLAEEHVNVASEGALLEVPVVYGGECGPDLGPLCAQLGLTQDEFIALHSSPVYPVETVGFTPGFAFIGGLHESLRIPRREQPRARVPGGSVGIADGRTGLYAIASPGGWTLVGRTPLCLFDPQAKEPFLIRPGMWVRFTPVSIAAFDS